MNESESTQNNSDDDIHKDDTNIENKINIQLVNTRNNLLVNSRVNIDKDRTEATMEIDSKVELTDKDFDTDNWENARTTSFFECEWGDQSVMILCVNIVAFLHPIISYGFWLIVPYYLIEHKSNWTGTQLGILYALNSVGEICGQQVIPFAAIFDSNIGLFIGHASQIIMGLVGYIFISGIIIDGYIFFVIGMFLIGYSYGMTCVQAYVTEISDDDDDIELSIMSTIGKLYILGYLFQSFILTNVYDIFYWKGFCYFQSLLCFISLISLAILIYKILNKIKDYEDELGLDFSNINTNTRERINEEDSSSLKKPTYLDAAKIPYTSILSPSLYMLLFLKIGHQLATQIYVITYPTVFTLWGITPNIGGYLFACGSIFGCLILFINAEMRKCFKFWEYPYDIIFYFSLILVTMILYVIIYDKIIAYLLHWLVIGSFLGIVGMEMTTRLYLCPTYALQQITGLIGILSSITTSIGSLLAPILLNISIKLSFTVLVILIGTLIVFALSVYFGRLTFLRAMGKNTGSYLSKERAYYTSVEKTSKRRGALVDENNNKIISDDEFHKNLDIIREEFNTRRGTSFIINPNARYRLESFANNAMIRHEINEIIETELQKKRNSDGNKSAIFNTKLGSVYNKTKMNTNQESKKSLAKYFRRSVNINKESIYNNRFSRTSILQNPLARSSLTLTNKNIVAQSLSKINENSRNSLARNSLYKRTDVAVGLATNIHEATNIAKARASQIKKNSIILLQ